MNKVIILAFAFIILTTNFSIAQATEMVNMPLGHEVYDFIDRMTVKGIIPKILTNILPLTRGEIAELLKQISDKVEGQEAELTNAELARLNDLLVLFVDELERLGLKIEDNPHFLQAKGFVSSFGAYHAGNEGEEYNLAFDADFSQEFTFLRSGVKASASSLKPTVIGSIKHRFAFATDVQSHLVIGEAEHYPYRTENTYHFSENVDGTHMINAYIKFKLPWFDLQLGKDNLWWGPGRYGALLVSDNAPSWDMLKLTASYGRLHFNSFTAILRSELGDKYLSGHRLEALISSRLRFGIHEVVVYANRFELHYLNPITVYFFAVPALEPVELNDNMLNGVDVEFIPVKNLKLYGELMVDDFQMQDRNLLNWANIFGILFGAYYVDAFGLKNTDLHAEYAFVNQFAYTHVIPINSYQHYDYVIGHWLGPDADDLKCDITHYLSDRFSLKLTYELERQGEGAVDKSMPPPGENEWQFLSGITEKRQSLGLGLRYKTIGRYSFLMSYRYIAIRNEDNEPGNKSDSHIFSLKADYSF